MTAERCSEELQNGQDVVVRIPGFGQFLMQLTGVCDCNCSSQTVGHYFFCLSFFIYKYFSRKKIVHFVILAMVVLSVDNVNVMKDGKHTSVKHD